MRLHLSRDSVAAGDDDDSHDYHSPVRLARRSKTVRRRLTLRVPLSLGLVALSALVSCSDGEYEWVLDPPVTVPDGAEFTAGLSLASGSGFGATQWTGSSLECSLDGLIVKDLHKFVVIAMWGPECVNPEAFNTNPPRYSSVTDVVDAEEVAVQRVTEGTAHVYEQIAEICTNDCREYTTRVVILELDTPIKPDHPTVMFSTLPLYAAVSVDEMIAIADAIRTHHP
jgi:hypothetical protein